MSKASRTAFLKTLALFAAVFLAGFLLVEWLAQTGALATYARFIAAQTSALCQVFGIEQTLSGLSIITQTRELVIVAECTAAFLMITYVALVIAYPFSPAVKGLAIVGGLLIIYLLNAARLVLTVALADHVSDATFNFMHNIFFQGLMIMVLLVMWAMLLSFDKTGRVPREALIFFGMVLVLLFVFEGVVVWLSSADSKVFPLSEMVYLPPALAVIACARGRNLQQKALLFLATCIFFVGGVQIQSIIAQAIRTGEIAPTVINLWLTEIFYGITIVGIPILSVVFAAGAKPSTLWEKYKTAA